MVPVTAATVAFVLSLVAFAAAVPAHGKALEDRVGFGMEYFHFDNTAALSLRYFPSNYLSVDFMFGFNTDSLRKSTTLGIKLSRNLNLEENMNFFVAVAGYLLSIRDPLISTQQNTGVEFNGLLGAEFFLPGVPHLGVALEAGLALQSLSTVVFQSVAGGAIHYYF